MHMCPGCCILLKVDLQRGGFNRVPLARVIGCYMEVEMLFCGPAVVGQDGVHDVWVVVVLERVFGRRVPDELGQHTYLSVRHQVLPCRAGCGIRWSCVPFQYLCLILWRVLYHAFHVHDVRVPVQCPLLGCRLRWLG